MISRLIKLTEICERSIRGGAQKKFTLGEVLVNPHHISHLREDDEYRRQIKFFRSWPAGLSEEVKLTRIYFVNNSEANSICVVGSFENIALKFGV